MTARELWKDFLHSARAALAVALLTFPLIAVKVNTVENIANVCSV